MSDRNDEYDGTPSGITPTPSGITRSPILSNAASYGCRVNQIAVDQLFQRYAELNFLYPAKLEKLAPYMDEVQQTWRKLIAAGDDLIRVVDIAGEKSGRKGWGSVTGWRTTFGGWNWQHLVSTGNPIYPRTAMLAIQAEMVNDEMFRSCQNWFRPDNRMPAKIFGTLMESVGTAAAMAMTYDLVGIPKDLRLRSGDCEIVELDPGNKQHCQGLLKLAMESKGEPYARSEELDSDDLLLSRLDQIYRKADLKRYRRIWLALDPEEGGLVGGLIANRGPLGLNFSFLENRCDLLLTDSESNRWNQDAISGMIQAALGLYDDFSPEEIPLVVQSSTQSLLTSMGAKPIRQYTHSVWLRDGFVAYYRHLESFYVRLLRAYERRGKLDRSLVPKPDGGKSNLSSEKHGEIENG